MKACTVIICFFILLMSPATAAAQGMETLRIGAGQPSGVYFTSAEAIKRIIKGCTPACDIKLSIETSGDNVQTTEAVASGRYDLAMISSDRLCEASSGSGPWRSQPLTGLRAAFSLNAGLFLITREQAKSLTSGESWLKREQALAFSALATNGAGENSVPVVVNRAILIENKRTGRIMVRFLIMSPGQLKAAAARNACYQITRIPSMFNGIGGQKALSARTTITTRSDVPEEAIYQLTKAVFQNIDQLRVASPSFSELNPSDMSTGLAATVHPGAARYFREAGLGVERSAAEQGD